LVFTEITKTKSQKNFERIQPKYVEGGGGIGYMSCNQNLK